MRARRRFARVVTVAILFTCSRGMVAAQAPALDGLDAFVSNAMKAWEVPGVAVAVVKNDEVVFARGYGVRELGGDAKVDEKTLFAIASNSKAFTAALLGMLVDEKKLGWDTRVIDVLPWFRLHDPWVTRDLRVDDLLCHRSGLPTFGGDHLWIASSLTRRQILERVRHLEPTAPFRAKFQYQNLMFVAAGELIPALTKERYRDMLRRRIFEPLGMKDSVVGTKGLADRDNVASPHEKRGGGVKRVAYDDTDVIAAAGGIVSNVIDVSKWIRLNLAYGRSDGRRLISERVVRAMQTSHTPIPVSVQATRDGTRFLSYGLGWGLSDYRGRKIVAHGGGLSGMISRVALVPDEGLGVVVLSNHAPNALPRAVVLWILDRYLGADDKDWTAVYRAREKRGDAARAKKRQALLNARIPGTQPRVALSAYAGRYRNSMSGDATVSVRDGKLFFHYDDRHQSVLEHWHHDTFRVRWINRIYDLPPETFLTFGLAEDGRVAKLWTTFYHPIRFDRLREDSR